MKPTCLEDIIEMTSEEKVDSYSDALSQYEYVATHIDSSKCKGLPSLFKGNIRLDLGLNAAVPIPDLCVDEDGISCTLSFSRIPHFVTMPWNAVLYWESADEANARNANKNKSVPYQNRGVVGKEGNVVKVRFGR